MPDDYKKTKLQEITDYKNQMYTNYADLTKSINAYILGISSSAIFAFFVLLHKFGSSLNNEDIFSIKIITILFLYSLLAIVITTVGYAIHALVIESSYSTLTDNIKELEEKETIKSHINSAHKKVTNSIFYKLFGIARYLAYFTFILAIILIGLLIFGFEVKQK